AAGVIAGTCLLLAVYCAVDPFRHSVMSEFRGFQVFPVDLLEIPLDRDSQNLLQRSEIKFLDQVQGPESLAFDPIGRGPYTGVADGRILFWDGQKWTHFAHTSPNRSQGLCDPKPSITDYSDNEHICGRPLGLRFDKRNGDLYIADAYLGLMKVGPRGGLATSLATEAEGIPLGFTNDLDIDEHGNVYFSDSSTNYRRRNYMQLIYTADNTGRLIKYDPTTKQTRVLVRNLQFPNGVSLSKDGSFFAYCEFSRARLSKYWLKGEKAGTTEIMAALPGYPDNVRTNEEGEFWVAVPTRRMWYADFLGRHPSLRKLRLKLPLPIMRRKSSPLNAMVIKYSPEGKILKILEDEPGKVVRAVSEVDEKDGRLWMGTVILNSIAVYQLD
ncbi:hypothetical protein M569_07898, partial [Genlisea aurea]